MSLAGPCRDLSEAETKPQFRWMEIHVGGAARISVENSKKERIVCAGDSVIVNEMAGASVEVNTVDDVSDTSDARPSIVTVAIRTPRPGTWIVVLKADDEGNLNVSAQAELEDNRICDGADFLTVGPDATRSWLLKLTARGPADSCALELRRR